MAAMYCHLPLPANPQKSSVGSPACIAISSASRRAEAIALPEEVNQDQFGVASSEGCCHTRRVHFRWVDAAQPAAVQFADVRRREAVVAVVVADGPDLHGIESLRFGELHIAHSSDAQFVLALRT